MKQVEPAVNQNPHKQIDNDCRPKRYLLAVCAVKQRFDIIGVEGNAGNMADRAGMDIDKRAVALCPMPFPSNEDDTLAAFLLRPV